MIGQKAAEMEEKHETITETKTQRNFLITKVIAAQRLALDRCDFSYKFAQVKAWEKWRNHSRMGMRKKYGGTIAKNIRGIDNAKENIAEIDERNDQLAQENDDLKSKAAKSMDMIHTAKDLQMQIETMISNLADKAFEIRQLLEDNKKLNRQLAKIGQ